MSKIPFTHLHVHSDASLMDGLGPVSRLVEAAARKGFDTLALTDHGTMANAIAFTLACQEAQIKPLLGIEGYISYEDETGHITLLAKGKEGFENLVKLNNMAHANRALNGKRPAFTISQLADHAEGIVCLTGCVSSPMIWLERTKALRYAGHLKDIFGGRLFAEIMFVSDTNTWDRPLEMAKRFGLKHVITNDAHFPFEQDAEIHSTLTLMKASMEYNSAQLWLKTGDQILRRAQSYVDDDIIIKGLKNAYKLGELLPPINLAHSPTLPKLSGSVNVKALALEQLKISGKSKDAKYTKRLDYEFDIIQSMGYESYFVILKDLVDYARKTGVRVGPGRGSGAGSLILYLLGITEVDPLQFGLSFERFLHNEREGFPDVDVDFDSEGRHQVIEYALNKYGAMPIATYSRYRHASLVHDLAKTLRLPRDKEKVAADKGILSDEFKGLEDANPKFGMAYDAFLGQIRHKGKHAGGIIITDAHVPIERAGAEELVAAWTEGDKNELSYAGIVKFDILGLTALSAIKDLEGETGKRPPKPYDDDKVFELFRKGDLTGIFQFSGSPGIIRLTKEVVPKTLEDLIAINALYRPGALDAGSTAKYVEWKTKPRLLHPAIDPILEETYGAIVYQEQVMSIYAKITGQGLAAADNARRVIVKSKIGDIEWEKKVLKLEEVFVSSAVDKKMSMADAKMIWLELKTHARYSFNKAHATAYCFIAYEMAWWKVYHPVLFYTAMLKADPSEFQSLVFDAALKEIKVVPPHVNKSSASFVADVKDNKIYLPFKSIKFLGDKGSALLANENKKTPYASFKDFDERVPKRNVTSRARLGLYAVDGFEGISGSPLDAGIDTTKLPPMDAREELTFELQNQYMGAVLPSPELIMKITAEQKAGRESGIIIKKKEKESSYGKYTVYYLAPNGAFWVRGNKHPSIGEAVSVQVNRRTGRALRIKQL